MKTLTTSPLILKIWKPHPFSLRNSHKLSLRDSHKHYLMPLTASIYFLTDLIISNAHKKLCNKCWMITVCTPPLRWRIFKSESFLSPPRLKSWQVKTSTFGHSSQKKGVVFSWRGVHFEGEQNFETFFYCFYSLFILLCSLTLLYFKLSVL